MSLQTEPPEPEVVVVDGFAYPSHDLKEADGDIVFFLCLEDIERKLPLPTGENVAVETQEQQFTADVVRACIEAGELTVRAIEEADERGGR